jgi:hypothetical protein
MTKGVWGELVGRGTPRKGAAGRRFKNGVRVPRKVTFKDICARSSMARVGERMSRQWILVLAYIEDERYSAVVRIESRRLAWGKGPKDWRSD